MTEAKPEMTAMEQAVADGTAMAQAAMQAAQAAQAEVAHVTAQVEVDATAVLEAAPANEVAWKKQVWTPEEDQQLRDLMAACGDGEKVRWSAIGEKMSGRSGKQCRERWHNHLSPDVCKDKWTEAEDAQLLEAVEKHGTRWAEIVKGFPGRTDNGVYNQYTNDRKDDSILPRYEIGSAASNYGMSRTTAKYYNTGIHVVGGDKPGSHYAMEPVCVRDGRV